MNIDNGMQQLMEFLPALPKVEKGAVLSECGLYRYQLWRIWDDQKPKVLFIMHNPSTADADDDDPTIRRCVAFVKSWGYGGFYVGNLTPYRATDPKSLSRLDYHTVYPDHNVTHIEWMMEKCDLFVLAFGVCRSMVAANEIYNLAHPSRWHCISITKDGRPGHPLYLPKGLPPIPFKSI